MEFRVRGSGLGAWDLEFLEFGFSGWSLGFGVWGLGFRVWVQGLEGCRVCWVL